MRSKQKAFIPYGTNAFAIASVVPPTLGYFSKIPLLIQQEGASLSSSTTNWFMLLLCNGSCPSRILMSCSSEFIRCSDDYTCPGGRCQGSRHYTYFHLAARRSILCCRFGQVFTIVVFNDHQPALCTAVQHILVLVLAFSRAAGSY